MKIHNYRFTTNNPDRKLEDIIYNLRTYSEDGIDTIWFQTRDMYIDIETNGTISGGGLLGNIIRIHPVILDEKGEYLSDTDFDKFMNHPNYYLLELVVENSLNTISTVTPLKHEYYINYIDDANLLVPYESMNPIELIDETVEEVLDEMVTINQENRLYE